ncbi:acyl-CoA dehydrogenase [Flavobacterium rakeshii]|uniref:Acyl-CoA dehydrogenase n=1 Tax=Flavobacterium rakeshii TaxID=1038845 RepID=A0A6N8HAU5_9FLAO|nr:acyl-CoA dehydrogenase family protein [Flavobacterium rakeshii]MUV02685.1 acyl-CoA dehydrogenase [Flavobacterium rakeshii]
MANFEFNDLWTQTIKEHAAQSEQNGKLHHKILNLIHSQNWFNIYVPKVYGGLEKPLPEILRLEEQIAKADGSTGWTVTLCSGAAWFAAFLDPDLAKEVFSNPKACLAGSGAATGTATVTPNGYSINGSWKYASGALHATHFTMNCMVKNNDGSVVFNNDNEELVLSFLLKKEEVTIVPNWPSMGMVASGSHSFTVNNIEVPSNRSFTINGSPKTTAPYLNYPFLQLAEATLAVNFLGMASHFIELVKDLFYNRSGMERFTPEQKSYFEDEFKKAQSQLQDDSQQFYEVVDLSWENYIKQDTIPNDILKQVSHYSRTLAHAARKVTDTLYPYCGLEAAKTESELNRVWRDLHTASQHSLLTFPF